jgi:hypothetical protein
MFRKTQKDASGGLIPEKLNMTAGWSSPVARQAHNLKVVGSNPTPATTFKGVSSNGNPLFYWSESMSTPKSIFFVTP